MTFTEAFCDLRSNLLCATCHNPHDKIEAIESSLKEILTTGNSSKRISLYPQEQLAVQHFVNQFGCHLEGNCLSHDNTGNPVTLFYIVPNWSNWK